MKIGSVFSGGGGGDLGFKSSGHQITFGCEINEYARSVLRKHNPDLIIYNDIKDITLERLLADGAEIPEVIFGGSPCQDLSVAGYREGLGGERSGLFTEQCRVADEISAPWIVWENVVGAFSSNKGRDFAEVLYYTTGFRPEVPSGGWKSGGVCIGPKRSAVWRVLDAQAFGVPQRRRRIFLIAGPRELASRVIDILFEPESSERNSTEGRKTGQEAAGKTQDRIGTSSVGALTEISQSILARYGSRGDLETETFIVENIFSNSTQESKPYVAFDSNYSGQYSIVNNGDISPTIKIGSNLNGQPPAIGCGDIIRRLTPVECERLMGWPDNYTEVGLADNRFDVNISNSQRYRICGNGIVSNVTYWIGNQLNKVLNV
jgi:DNA (cytosine-5)-methyltransferase 1